MSIVACPSCGSLKISKLKPDQGTSFFLGSINLSDGENEVFLGSGMPLDAYTCSDCGYTYFKNPLIKK
ncbi:hypothetical protein Q5O14_07730 [Eubacteriaceae bacterium ES2]|nr:hypothetical protein Q5O14_07730 [Eubacteriaceae bacterium ES2]